MTNRPGGSPARPGIAQAATGTAVSSPGGRRHQVRTGACADGARSKDVSAYPALPRIWVDLDAPHPPQAADTAGGRGDDRDARPGSAGRPPRLTAASPLACGGMHRDRETPPHRHARPLLPPQHTVNFPPHGERRPALGQPSHAVDAETASHPRAGDRAGVLPAPLRRHQCARRPAQTLPAHSYRRTPTRTDGDHPAARTATRRRAGAATAASMMSSDPGHAHEPVHRAGACRCARI